MNLSKQIILLLATILIVSARRDRIRLKDIETLTLYSENWTTSRRSAPVKQLACVGGYCNRAPLHTAQCYNRGFDGRDVQWECKGDLPINYKFGRLEVSCEGYDYSDDDYILGGSCGLEYTIEEKLKTSDSYYSSFRNLSNDVNDGASSMMTIIVFVGIAVALYFYLRRNKRPEPASDQSSFNANPSAPPPYGFRTDYNSSDGAYTGAGKSTSGSSGPGFFSGMATGGFLGYLFGSNRGNTGYGRHDRSYWNTPPGYSSYGMNSLSGESVRTTRTSTSTGFASTKRR